MVDSTILSRALIHIGTGKTGTSSIQRYLFHEVWRDPAFFQVYPDQQPQNVLVTLFQEPDRWARGLKTKFPREGPEREARLNQVRADWNTASRQNRLIVSAEFLMGLNDEEVRRFREDLQRLGYEHVGILVYVRRPADYFLSAVQQHLKASGTFDPPDKFRYPVKRLIQRWESVFPGTFRVRPFDRVQLRSGDVVEDFRAEAEAWFGRPLPPLERATRTNETLSAEGMVLLARYRQALFPDADNAVADDAFRAARMLNALEKSVPQQPVRLRPEVAQLVDGRHQEDLRFLEEAKSIRLLEKPASPPATVPRVRSVEDLIGPVDPEAVDHLLWHLLQAALEGADGRKQATEIRDLKQRAIRLNHKLKASRAEVKRMRTWPSVRLERWLRQKLHQISRLARRPGNPS